MRPSAMFGQGWTTIGNELATLDILRNSFLWKYKWPLTRASKQPQERAPHLPPSVHFFLLAFSAALVVLPHVPDGEPSKGRELGEGLDAHGLAGEQLDNGSVARLDELGRASSVDL